MYELMVRDSFAAAHSLRDYKGKKLGKDGLAVDFTILKDVLKKILDGLDHKHLNEDVVFFKKHNTSAENIARYIYTALKESVKKAKVSKICIFESENSMAAYSEK
jgi:6-pyruvoyltetrahydropterin/6-carboxytetrahydropterin synthase